MSETPQLAQRKTAPRLSRHDAPMPKIREGGPVEMATVRVTKKGAGHLSTGEHVSGEGDIMHEKDDIVQVPADAVAELEERGWAEAQ